MIKKMTKQKRMELENDLQSFNKRMKQAGRHSEKMSFDQYVAYRFGEGTKTYKYNKTVYKSSTVYRRSNNDHIPSVDSGAHECARPAKKEYTGTLVKGIATMHKSNAVPIINEEQAKDISQMRRN